MRGVNRRRIKRSVLSFVQCCTTASSVSYHSTIIRLFSLSSLNQSECCSSRAFNYLSAKAVIAAAARIVDVVRVSDLNLNHK